MFVWPMAAKAPSSMLAIAMKTMICCQSFVTVSNGIITTRTSSAMAAIFGAAAKNADGGITVLTDPADYDGVVAELKKDGTISEERIAHLAGSPTPVGLARHRMEETIAMAGFTAVERDGRFRPMARGGGDGNSVDSGLHPPPAGTRSRTADL